MRVFSALHVPSAKATTQEQLNKKFIELAQEKEALLGASKISLQ